MEKEDREKVRFRHEFKYLCTQAQAAALLSRLKGIMKADSHAGSDGIYRIRSLYFDDMHDRCYYENENGVCPREKYRIRIYNGQGNLMHLECKRKVSGMIQKQMCALNREQYNILAYGDGKVNSFDEMPELMQKLLMLMDTRRMRPRVIVEYDRRPFVYRDGNVRITFDSNISSSTRTERFFHEKVYGRPILPIGTQLLEVKYDSFLPDHIYQILQLAGTQRVTFSKYYLCRKFNDMSL